MLDPREDGTGPEVELGDVGGDGLTERGREEAELAALTLGHLSLDNPLVVSSPRKRALATAELAGLTVDDLDLVGLHPLDHVRHRLG